ncbi:hypothetical protein RJ40_10615 [Methanofollis aquaemaris]|uniref:Uncharacterized protein n=1 Tax=Methanofollis aquaemaris TaxID=126734 RepID=A0A8A3S896_9EURY|nr:hypothetical protein [Methanofollis aquaemaris]QSZ67914.1 hypothetical protein RJ40_10615 [Methanofollis aquaemaris]
MKSQDMNKWLWALVPVVAFGGVLVAVVALLVSGESIMNVYHPYWAIGKWACVAASVILAYVAYQKKRKDLVSLLAPLYAVLILLTGDFSGGPIMQVVYAATITILAVRLEKRFE